MRLIDADALEAHIHWECFENFDDDYEYVLKNDIDNAPTIDAEPVKRGEWEPAEVTMEVMETLGCRYDDRVYRCSRCGNLEFTASNYCRRCGAKMW